ncbi:hypothetical protein SAMN05216299_10372 [Nitrosospira sp. Nsp14]|nr:hypothetical protein SAMN05216299_10372 [Nitrosospira sp. Nsp14]
MVRDKRQELIVMPDDRWEIVVSASEGSKLIYT